MRRIAGPCCSSSRRWTRPARTARSSTSCPASTRRAARSTRSRRRRARTSTTTTCGAASECLPERGRIGIFNRSYYEETLVVRVHPEFLDKQKVPEERRSKNIWKERFEDIRNVERYLDRNGVIVRKFFLHVSKKEQGKRFLARIDDKERNWKFSANDAAERNHWNAYMEAYEDTIRNTATDYAPWYVVPADNKWFTRIVVAAAVIETLDSLDLSYPKVARRRAGGGGGRPGFRRPPPTAWF